MEKKPEIPITEDSFAEGIVRCLESAITTNLQRFIHDEFEFNYDQPSRENVIKSAKEVYQAIVTPLQSQLSEAEKRIAELEERNDCDRRTLLNERQKHGSENERLLSALKELKAFCVQEIAITENQLQIFKRDKNRDMKARCESSISTYEKILELLLINDSGER